MVSSLDPIVGLILVPLSLYVIPILCVFMYALYVICFIDYEAEVFDDEEEKICRCSASGERYTHPIWKVTMIYLDTKLTMWQCYWRQKITPAAPSFPSPALKTQFRAPVVPVHWNHGSLSMTIPNDEIRSLAVDSQETHFPDRSSLTQSEKISGDAIPQ